MFKDVFLHSRGQLNAFAYITRSNSSEYFFLFIERVWPKLSCVQMWQHFALLIIEIWPKMWFYKDRDLERSRSQVKTNGTIGFLDLKNIDLDTKIIILSALVQKLWSTTSFCIMVDNATRSHTSHVSNHSKYFFIYWKAPTQAILC